MPLPSFLTHLSHILHPQIPLPVSQINNDNHPVNVGLSDSFYFDRTFPNQLSGNSRSTEMYLQQFNWFCLLALVKVVHTTMNAILVHLKVISLVSNWWGSRKSCKCDNKLRRSLGTRLGIIQEVELLGPLSKDISLQACRNNFAVLCSSYLPNSYDHCVFYMQSQWGLCMSTTE